MKECNACGSQNSNDAKYCNVCGHRLGNGSVSRAWVWVLGMCAIALSGLWLSTWLSLRQARSNLAARDTLTQAVSRRYDQRLDSLQKAFYQLEAQKCSADHRLTDFQLMVGRHYPFIIDSIEIGNVNRIQQALAPFGSPIHSSETQYLQPRLHYRGILHGEVELYVKWYGPDGKLRVGDTSPAGYSQRVECYIYEESKVLNLKGWGSETPGNWRSGAYRLEVWCNGMLLGSKHFSIL